jgi:ligand-binding SRPBCC domain-containing protein
MDFSVATRVSQPPSEVFPVFGDASFVESLAPRLMGLKVVRIGLKLGDEIEVRFAGLGPRGPWISRIVSLEDGGPSITFVDRSEVLPWPFATFEHHHGFDAAGTGTTIVDNPRFTVRPAIIGPFVWLFLRWSFGYRQRIYRRRFGS